MSHRGERAEAVQEQLKGISAKIKHERKLRKLTQRLVHAALEKQASVYEHRLSELNGERAREKNDRAELMRSDRFDGFERDFIEWKLSLERQRAEERGRLETQAQNATDSLEAKGKDLERRQRTWGIAIAAVSAVLVVIGMFVNYLVTHSGPATRLLP
jgi:hypothetical protein